MAVKPADFSPPYAAAEFVGPPTDPADERIDVGVLIVGAGPAGLACAIRLGQLLAAEVPSDGKLADERLRCLDYTNAAA